MRHDIVVVVVSLASLCTAGACRRTPAAAAPEPSRSPVPAATSPDTADRAERDRLERERDERERRERERARIEEARRTVEASVHFGFDRSDLTAETRALLDAKIAVLQSNVSIKVRIEGHADERGSDEYNLALGQRRAAAARRYLVDHGVDQTRIEILSFGEEQRLCTDASESCHERNRRAAFRITEGLAVDSST